MIMIVMMVVRMMMGFLGPCNVFSPELNQKSVAFPDDDVPTCCKAQ
jgi:hypothetical protein